MKDYFTFKHLVRYGLGIVFIAHGLAALFAPAEFIELLQNSFVSGLLPVDPETFVKVVVTLNDTIVGLLLMGGIRLRVVALWATLWLIGVMVVIGDSLFEVLEHVGIVLVAVALIIEE